ncbi:S24 family peptidase [Oscillatoria sp. CS-180]|uniref:S24 family peptidase n=1 Tax=Oscillatoria sp. CS-180 TaxID=3021720 RepID=UPI00232D650D|nr:S24 family peptidase [Oscillatoria sp. CS-180]MDB9529577.1 S24 family peptidase [Oscillatoria sp. CS-180]
MGFPVPGDAIEQSLDLNRHLIHNPAAIFFMRVDGDAAADAAVLPGDLLVVDRSLTVQNHSLVVGIIDGQMQVLRVQQHGAHWVPVEDFHQGTVTSLEVWGVVTHIIRQV